MKHKFEVIVCSICFILLIVAGMLMEMADSPPIFTLSVVSGGFFINAVIFAITTRYK